MNISSTKKIWKHLKKYFIAKTADNDSIIIKRKRFLGHTTYMRKSSIRFLNLLHYYAREKGVLNPKIYTLVNIIL